MPRSTDDVSANREQPTILLQDKGFPSVLEEAIFILIVHVTLVLPRVLLFRELDGEQQVGVAQVVQLDLVCARILARPQGIFCNGQSTRYSKKDIPNIPIGLREDLLTIVKRCKLKWYGYVSRSSGLAITISRGTAKGGRRQ